jgi:hypothetical protein
MSPSKYLLALSTLLLAAPALKAQETSALTSPDKSAPGKYEPEYRSLPNGKLVPVHNKTVSLTLGTTGVGIEGRLAVSRRIAIRLGYNYARGKFSNTKQLRNSPVTLARDYESRATNVHVLADYMLPKILPKLAFRVTGGVAIFTEAQTKVTGVPVGSYKYGDIELNEDGRMGVVTVKADWAGPAAYAGIGLFNPIPLKHRIGLNLDLGTYYLPAPSVYMTATGYMAGNEANAQQIRENLSSYHFLPVLQLAVSYRL